MSDYAAPSELLPAVAGPASRTRARTPSALAVLVACVAITVVVFAASSPGWLRGVAVVAAVGALLAALQTIGRTTFGWAELDVAYLISLAFLVLLAGSALLAPLLPLREANEPDFGNLRQRPTIAVDEPLGTDDLGRSVLSRVVTGARVSLQISLGAAALGTLVGGTAGILAGFSPGRVDGAATFAADVMLSFPPLILLLAAVTVLPQRAMTITLCLAVLITPTMFRIARSNAMALAPREFIVAAQAMGAKRRRILVREVLPNIAPTLLAYLFVLVATLVVAEGSLSYLGVGIQPPTPSWGRMIADGQPLFDTDPHLVLVPSTAMLLTLLAVNKVSERLLRQGRDQVFL
jgi:peptide/nickel transport system permease protein